jgi:hypothetical protein
MILIGLWCYKQIWEGGGGTVRRKNIKQLTFFCLAETEHSFFLLLSEINTDVTNWLIFKCAKEMDYETWIS